MFNRCGGAKKAFTAGVLRQKFGKLPGLMKKVGRLFFEEVPALLLRFFSLKRAFFIALFLRGNLRSPTLT